MTPGVTQKLEYRLAFASDISLETANNLRARIAEVLERPDFGTLTILFSSEGGATDQSLALHNYITGLPVPVHMHAGGHVGSASVPIFLAAENRSCAVHARFFFHEYDWEFEGPQTLRRINEAVQRLSDDIDWAKKIIAGRTQAGPEILNALDGVGPSKILLPDDAKLLGFVSEVRDLNNKAGRGAMPFVVWTV
jgi:ATP-dependent protease ClpP protease subunit